MQFIRLILTLFALTLASPAFAATPYEFRQLVYAGDIAGVTAALTEAEARDKASPDEPYLQRNLFTIFTESHDKVNDFTVKWLASEPDSPYAQTARGWQLYAEGWNMRGHAFARDVFPDAMRALMRDHRQAFDLAQQALAQDGDLISASDLELVLTSTLGKRNLIPIELERVMTLRPNRGSLMRAMDALAPQWGGRTEQVKLLCDRYAAKNHFDSRL